MIITRDNRGVAYIHFDNELEAEAFGKWIVEVGQPEFLRWRMAGE